MNKHIGSDFDSWLLEDELLDQSTAIAQQRVSNWQNKGAKVENQHRRISGYRELSQEEIDLMNEIKAKGVELGELVGNLYTLNHINGDGSGVPTNQQLESNRWLGIGKDHLQQGLMALTRAVAKPEFF
jgi:hypothetical protein